MNNLHLKNVNYQNLNRNRMENKQKINFMLKTTDKRKNSIRNSYNNKIII